MSDLPDSLAGTGRIDPLVWRTAAVVLIGPFMTQLDSTVVNVSLSTIGQSLHASIDTAQWLVSGYLLAMALMLPLTGWIVDRIGAKRVYLGCFSAFTLASMLCGAAQTMESLICARVLQGLAGGILAPMTQMMIARVAGRHMARVMGYTALPILIGPVIGPVLAGIILTHGTWPLLFYLNLPVGMLGVALAVYLLPRDSAALQRRPFDFTGFMLISPGLVGLMYGLQNASHGAGQGALLAGALLLCGFLWHALRKGSAALIDVRIFRTGIFPRAAATQFFSNGMLFGRQLLIPLYLITGCALSATQTGWLIAAIGVGMMCSFPFIGFLTERFGTRAVSAGGAFLAFVSILPFLWMIEHQFSVTWALISLFVAGMGQGTINIPSVSAAFSSVPRERLPVASTALNIAQRLGGPIGTTLLAVTMSYSMHGYIAGQPQRFLAVFLVLTLMHLLALASALRLPVRILHAPPQK